MAIASWNAARAAGYCPAASASAPCCSSGSRDALARAAPLTGGLTVGTADAIPPTVASTNTPTAAFFRNNISDSERAKIERHHPSSLGIAVVHPLNTTLEWAHTYRRSSRKIVAGGCEKMG